MTDPDSETCPACGERATVETYRSTRPGEGEFLITQWRCPNVAKRLTRTQLLLGKKPKQGTHPTELAAATDFHSPSALVEKPSDVFLDDQVDQAEAPPEVAPPDESPSEIWVATSRQDLLDQAVAILRKVPLVDRPHLLEIVYRQEQLEQMQAEFRKKLLGA